VRGEHITVISVSSGEHIIVIGVSSGEHITVISVNSGGNHHKSDKTRNATE